MQHQHEMMRHIQSQRSFFDKSQDDVAERASPIFRGRPTASAEGLWYLRAWYLRVVYESIGLCIGITERACVLRGHRRAGTNMCIGMHIDMCIGIYICMCVCV